MKHYEHSAYVYTDPALYKDPDFSIFRSRLHPIVMDYLKPKSYLQKRIDEVMSAINTPFKIGIHIRSLCHYQNYNKTSKEFLENIERDVDEIMSGKDPATTTIFLATLLEPVVERLSRKYKVVTTNVYRTNDMYLDWTFFDKFNNLQAAEEVIIDTWCLAQCNELWCGTSNMVIFAGCLNPGLVIKLLPSLDPYTGN
jgi:hypothetical protein